jgi:TIR domain
MAARTVFCSYARGDAEAVRAIAVELDQLGQHAWIDQKLTGGQSWWDTILGQIRACDCFLFALSDASLRSKACQAELDYAHRLGRTILPVAVGPVIDALLPPHLAEIQRIQAGDTRMLARALLGLPPTPPLPDPLPEPPPVPITYLNSLASILDREELTPADQRNLEGSLKQRLANPEERDAAVALLKRLRQHPSVTAFVADEIDADLAVIEPPAAPSPPRRRALSLSTATRRRPTRALARRRAAAASGRWPRSSWSSCSRSAAWPCGCRPPAATTATAATAATSPPRTRARPVAARAARQAVAAALRPRAAGPRPSRPTTRCGPTPPRAPSRRARAGPPSPDRLRSAAGGPQ